MKGAGQTLCTFFCFSSAAFFKQSAGKLISIQNGINPNASPHSPIQGDRKTATTLEAEVRQLDPPDAENPVGTIQYYLNLRLNLSTDSLSDKILASDPHIEGIQWTKTKNATDVYQ